MSGVEEGEGGGGERSGERSGSQESLLSVIIALMSFSHTLSRRFAYRRLKLKFMDVGKWSGRGDSMGSGAGVGLAGMSRSMGVGGLMGMMGDIQGLGGGGIARGGGEGTDKRNFARISREFEKMRRDRKWAGMGGGTGIGDVLRKTVDGGVNGGAMVFSTGHSKQLRGKGGGGEGTYAEAGMLGGYSDRRDFF